MTADRPSTLVAEDSTIIITVIMAAITEAIMAVITGATMAVITGAITATTNAFDE